MFKLYVVEVLVVTALLVAAVSETNRYEPTLTAFWNLTSIKYEIGDYVEDARILQNIGFNKEDRGEVTRDFTGEFIFPSVYTDVNLAALELPITRIVVLAEKTHDEQTIEAKVISGGINHKSVELEIKVGKSYNFNYKVVLFGPTF